MSTERWRQYRWEFLRRNPRYRRDFESLQKEILKHFLSLEPLDFQRKFHRVWLALNDFPPEKVEKDFPGVGVKKVKECFIELGRFKEKWRVLQPQNPNHGAGPDFVSDASPKVPPVEVLLPALESEERGARFLNLRIDLGSSPEEILKQVQDILILQRKIYAEEEEIQMKNPQWARLDQCLLIYDEVIHHGKSLEEGCQILYPEFNHLSNSEKSKLLDQSKILLNDAKNFVELGFDMEG